MRLRISSIQKDVLFMLYTIKQKGSDAPVPSMTLLNMITSSRGIDIDDRNFRTSCHKLKGHGFIELYRSKHLKLAWSLTPEGEAKAKPIYEEIQGNE